MSKYILVSIDEKGIGWAVESEREKPDESLKLWNQMAEWEQYIHSLPRLECHPDLWRGLRVWDQLPECEPEYQITTTKGWVKTHEAMYSRFPDEQRRIILVPVEANDFWVECNVCKQHLKNWVGSTPCCGYIAYIVEEQGEDELWEPTKAAVSFVDWISDYGWMRLSKSAGHKWFKIGVVENYTTEELFNKFCEEMNNESIHHHP